MFLRRRGLRGISLLLKSPGLHELRLYQSIEPLANRRIDLLAAPLANSLNWSTKAFAVRQLSFDAPRSNPIQPPLR